MDNVSRFHFLTIQSAASLFVLLAGCQTTGARHTLAVLGALEGLNSMMIPVSDSLDEVGRTDWVAEQFRILERHGDLAEEFCVWSVEITGQYGYVASEWLRIERPETYKRLPRTALLDLHLRRFAADCSTDEWAMVDPNDGTDFELGTAGQRMAAFGTEAIPGLRSCLTDVYEPHSERGRGLPDYLEMRRMDLAAVMILKILNRPTAKLCDREASRDQVIAALRAELETKD